MNNLKCNDTWDFRTELKAISYEFVTVDGNTPDGCVIRPGDIDPITGEVITEEFFEEYRKILHEEAIMNIEAERLPYSRKEQALRRQQRADIAAELEAMGCEVTRDAIDCQLDGIWGNRYNIHIDAINCDTEEESALGKLLCFADDDAEKAFRRAEFDEIELLEKIVAGFTPRQKEVFDLMLDEMRGTENCVGRCLELSAKYGISPAAITKSKKAIREKIRKAFEGMV